MSLSLVYAGGSRVHVVDTAGRVVCAIPTQDSALGPANAGTALAASILHQATVLLDNAAILLLPTTALALLPAPGTNRMLWPHVVIATLDAQAGAYTNVDGAGAYFTSGLGVSNATYALWTESQSESYPILATGQNDLLTTVLTMSKAAGYLGGLTADVANVSFWIGFNNGVSLDFTGGHDDNTLRVSVAYYILNLTSGIFE